MGVHPGRKNLPKRSFLVIFRVATPLSGLDGGQKYSCKATNPLSKISRSAIAKHV